MFLLLFEKLLLALSSISEKTVASFKKVNTCWTCSFLLTLNLPNQGSARSFLRTPNLPNQGSARSFLRTQNQPNQGPFSELRTCRTSLDPFLTPNSEPAEPGLTRSNYEIRTPGKNTILDHLGILLIFVKYSG